MSTATPNDPKKPMPPAVKPGVPAAGVEIMTSLGIVQPMASTSGTEICSVTCVDIVPPAGIVTAPPVSQV